MLASSLKDETLTPELAERLLFQGIEDEGKSGDCLIVLGSGHAMKNRVPAAAEAYHRGRAPKLMVCGGVTGTTPGRTVSEADHMSLAAIGLGVPQDDILVENTSANTIENILCAMLVLQRSFYLNRVQRVLLVTSPYHMRRSLMIARYLFPRHIEVSPCPSEDLQHFRESWQQDSRTAKTVMAEARNLLMYVHNGIIPDFEI